MFDGRCCSVIFLWKKRFARFPRFGMRGPSLNCSVYSSFQFSAWAGFSTCVCHPAGFVCRLACLMLVLWLTGPGPAQGAPVLMARDAAVLEGNSGTTNLAFHLTLS